MKTQSNSRSECLDLTAMTNGAESQPWVSWKSCLDRNIFFSIHSNSSLCQSSHKYSLFFNVLALCYMIIKRLDFFYFLGLLTSHFVELKYQSRKEQPPKKTNSGLLPVLRQERKLLPVFRHNVLCNKLTECFTIWLH